MIFKPFYYFDAGCAAYVFGCGTVGKGAVVEPQERDEDAYLAFAEANLRRGPDPWFVLTGDTLFVGAVGPRISQVGRAKTPLKSTKASTRSCIRFPTRSKCIQAISQFLHAVQA